MSTDLVPVTRPDGRVYKPRKPPRAVEVENSDYTDPPGWIYVHGTHDVERAYELASKYWRGVDKDSAQLTWIRQAMRNGDSAYDHDPVRGAAVVTFEWWD